MTIITQHEPTPIPAGVTAATGGLPLPFGIAAGVGDILAGIGAAALVGRVATPVQLCRRDQTLGDRARSLGDDEWNDRNGYARALKAPQALRAKPAVRSDDGRREQRLPRRADGSVVPASPGRRASVGSQ